VGRRGVGKFCWYGRGEWDVGEMGYTVWEGVCVRGSGFEDVKVKGVVASRGRRDRS